MTIRVAVNGYGVIGRRVADAVALQDDMQLVGVADVASDFRIRTAVWHGHAVFAASDEAAGPMRAAGIDIQAGLEDLLRAADVVVDCTPKRVEASNLERYRAAGVKAIFQGGGSHDLAGHSFVANANYESALGLDATRVVSCNTTSTVRTLGALRKAGLLRRARGTLIRRATDPWESHLEGIINTLVPEPGIPSHQGPDAKRVIPDLDVTTMAVKAPDNVGHLHYWSVDLARPASKEEVLAAFAVDSRIAFIRHADGIAALNVTAELMKEMGRPRGDMWEVALWEDMLVVDGLDLHYAYQVDNQAIVVPETIDAIRALSGAPKNGAESIARTDASLGIRQRFLEEIPA